MASQELTRRGKACWRHSHIPLDSAQHTLLLDHHHHPVNVSSRSSQHRYEHPTRTNVSSPAQAPTPIRQANFACSIIMFGSASLSDAQKEQRRQRFFRAISSAAPPEQPSTCTTTANTIPSKAEEPEQTEPANTASSSSSVTSLSAEQIQDVLKLLKPKRKEADFNTLSLEEQQQRRNTQQQLLFAHPATLDPATRATQKEMFEDLRRQDLLKKTPMDALPLLLQGIKLTLEDTDKKLHEADGTADCERRINELLCANGEPEIPFDTFVVAPYQDDGLPGSSFLRERMRLKDLEHRKPALFAQVWPLLEHYADAPQLHKLSI